MGRTHEQNLALAERCASLFRSVLRPVAAAVNSDALFSKGDVELYDYALTHLDRKYLWELYTKQRILREQAKRAMWAELKKGHEDDFDYVPPPELVNAYYADPVRTRTILIHAFLARACIAPATALKGRAIDFLMVYLIEGLEYASRLLIPTDETKRLELLELWKGALPNLSNLDTRQEGLYVPSDAR
jgi:hypothetical protein